VSAHIFKEEAKEGVIAWHVKDSDSYFTCMNAYKELNMINCGKNFYKLERYKLDQKILELQELRNSQRELKLKHGLLLQNLHEEQLSLFFVELQKYLPLQENIEHIKRLIEVQNKISHIAIQEGKIIIEKYKPLLEQKKEEIEQYKSMKNAYYMIMGTSDARNVVGKLTKDYVVDYITIEKQITTDLKTEALENEKRNSDLSPQKGHRYELIRKLTRSEDDHIVESK
jgi:hypothetical protein